MIKINNPYKAHERREIYKVLLLSAVDEHLPKEASDLVRDWAVFYEAARETLDEDIPDSQKVESLRTFFADYYKAYENCGTSN